MRDAYGPESNGKYTGSAKGNQYYSREDFLHEQQAVDHLVQIQKTEKNQKLNENKFAEINQDNHLTSQKKEEKLRQLTGSKNNLVSNLSSLEENKGLLTEVKKLKASIREQESEIEITDSEIMKLEEIEKDLRVKVEVAKEMSQSIRELALFLQEEINVALFASPNLIVSLC